MGFYYLIHDNKRLNDIILVEFVICQCSNNAWKCEQWLMEDLVQKLKKNKIKKIMLLYLFDNDF